MTRINTNVPSLLAAMYFNRNTDALNLALSHLSTGVRINSAKDDPSGIIVTDIMRSQITGIQDATKNAERASNLVATADGSLSNLSDLILQIKQIIQDSANSGTMTAQELSANQLQIDNDVATINQIIGTSSFGGQKLLDGSLAYNTTPLDATALLALTVNSAPVTGAGNDIPIQIDLTASATQPALTFPNATVAGDVAVSLTGPEGTQRLDFAAGTTSAQMVMAINGVTDLTGLSAAYVNGDPAQGVVISTANYGSRARISASMITGNAADFDLKNSAGVSAMSAQGADAQANINGHLVVGNGMRLHYVGASLDLELDLQPAWNTAGPPASTTFRITSGGALFQIGSQIGIDQQVAFGLPQMDSAHLGQASLGFLDSLTSGKTNSLASGNLSQASKIVDAAGSQVVGLRARIGAFQNNTLAMITDNLQQSLENVSEARSKIMDTDYASETALMARQQVLATAAQSAMALANQVPQYVLQMLKG